MYTIKNLWNKIIPVCGNHGKERIKLQIKEGPFSLFYSCPRYYPENRSPGERACNNRINTIDYEKMVNHLGDIIASEEVKGNSIDLTNYQWESKGIHFKVLEDNGEDLIVEILNIRAMKS